MICSHRNGLVQHCLWNAAQPLPGFAGRCPVTGLCFPTLSARGSWGGWLHLLSDLVGKKVLPISDNLIHTNTGATQKVRKGRSGHPEGEGARAECPVGLSTRWDLGAWACWVGKLQRLFRSLLLWEIHCTPKATLMHASRTPGVTRSQIFRLRQSLRN